MRTFSIILITTLFAACGQTKSSGDIQPSRVFISGVYATFEKARYCTTWDTLIVSRSATQKNLYLVLRHCTFQRNLNDEFFPVEQVVTKWTGVYDNTSQTLSGLGHAADIQFIPDRIAFNFRGLTYTRVE